MPLIFWHGQGRRYRNLSSRFQALTRRRDFAGERFRLHDLRHRSAVAAMKDGASIYDVQAWLGHGSIKTTEIYLRYLTPEEQRVAMRVNG